MNLTPKQKAFCDYYLQTGNATEAHKMAGYKNYKSAGVEANKTLKNPNVQTYIKERNKALDASRIATIEQIKEFWTNTLNDGEIRHTDRIKASELLAKTYGAFIDKVEHSGELDIKVEWANDED